MMDDCNNCFCPSNDQAKEELIREQAIKNNETERKKLIMDLEAAGVMFPVTEVEMMAHQRLLGDDYPTGLECADGTNDNQSGPNNGDLTQEDYATNMPDDLKNLLRRYYELEAEREKLGLNGTGTAPNSENGDEENLEALYRVKTPRAPFWALRRNSVAIVENEKDGRYEAQARSGKSKHAWISGDDASESSSRVTVVYSKERTRKIRMGLFCCCLVLLGLAAVTVYYAMDFDEKDESTVETLPEFVEPTSMPVPSPTKNPTAAPTEDPCVNEVRVIQECHIRGEPIGFRFNNCDPLPDDWVALYAADEDPSNLSDVAVEWMYTCGNKQCRGVVQSSFYVFQIFEPGTYRIHMIRNKDSSPYIAYASSAELEVVENRADCPTDFGGEDIPENITQTVVP